MKNLYGNFFIQSQSRIDFLKRGKSRFIQSEISCQNESVSSKTRFWRLFILHAQSFHKFTQVFSKICHKPQTKFEQVYRLDKPIKRYIQEEQSKNSRTKTRWDARLAWPLKTLRSVQFVRTVKTLHPSRTLPAKPKNIVSVANDMQFTDR